MSFFLTHRLRHISVSLSFLELNLGANNLSTAFDPRSSPLLSDPLLCRCIRSRIGDLAASKLARIAKQKKQSPVPPPKPAVVRVGRIQGSQIASELGAREVAHARLLGERGGAPSDGSQPEANATVVFVCLFHRHPERYSSLSHSEGKQASATPSLFASLTYYHACETGRFFLCTSSPAPRRSS